SNSSQLPVVGRVSFQLVGHRSRTLLSTNGNSELPWYRAGPKMCISWCSWNLIVPSLSVADLRMASGTPPGEDSFQYSFHMRSPEAVRSTQTSSFTFIPLPPRPVPNRVFQGRS